MASAVEHERAQPPARLHPPQGRLPQAAAPHRGPGPRPAADGRGREVLHRHPHPGLGDDQGAAVGRPRPARRAPEPLRGRGRAQRRPRGRREGPRGLRGHRPPRPLLTAPTPERNPAMSTTTYTVTGMTCGHCVSAVTEEVTQVPGVTAVEVDLASGAADRHQRRARSTTPPSAPPSRRPATRWPAAEVMNTPLKLAGFALGLVAVFGAAVGRRQRRRPGRRRPRGRRRRRRPRHGGRRRRARRAAAGAAARCPAGCRSSAGRLHARPRRRPRCRPARPHRSPFRILGPDGQPVTALRRRATTRTCT